MKSGFGTKGQETDTTGIDWSPRVAIDTFPYYPTLGLLRGTKEHTRG